MESVNVPKPGKGSSEGPVRVIRTAVNILTLMAGVLALSAQVLEHFRKPKADPNDRTKAGDALMGLAILRTLPGLIRSARTLAADMRRAK